MFIIAAREELLQALATIKVISEPLPACESAHSWQRLYNAATSGYQTPSTMTRYPTPHIILILS